MGGLGKGRETTAPLQQLQMARLSITDMDKTAEIALISWLWPASVYLGLELELVQRQAMTAFSIQENAS